MNIAGGQKEGRPSLYLFMAEEDFNVSSPVLSVLMLLNTAGSRVKTKKSPSAP